MDFGISGKNALVCAASKGLGRGCAEALAAEGANVVIVARTEDVLRKAAGEIAAATGAEVTPIAADITTDEGREKVLGACPAPDILVNNAGGPPPGDFRDWGRDEWVGAVEANMLTPILLVRATIDGMIERGFGRIVNITSGAVKAPIPELGLSNGARSGLTGFVAGLARQVAPHGVTINNLLPGRIATDRLRSNIEFNARNSGIDFEQEWDARQQTIPARRFGTPEEFGALCAFLCSRQAGYLTAQNYLVDGGLYPGTF